MPDFPPSVRDQIIDETVDRCAGGCHEIADLGALPWRAQTRGTEAAHIINSGDGGPGVFWNGIALCANCNQRRQSPRRCSLADPKTASEKWYNNGYSSVSAKLYFYQFVDTLAFKVRDRKLKDDLVDLLQPLSVCLSDINFMVAAKECNRIAHELADEYRQKELYLQDFCTYVDSGDLATARQIHDQHLAKLASEDLLTFIKRISWRTPLIAESKSELDNFNAMLKDMATHNALDPEFALRAAIVLSLGQIASGKSDAALEQAFQSKKALANRAARPQTIQRQCFSIDEAASRGVSSKEIADFRRDLGDYASCSPIRRFMIPDPEKGVKNATGELHLRVGYRRRYAGSFPEYELQVLEVLRRLESQTKTVLRIGR